MSELWLWRAKHFDGKMGAWQPCYGFKPVGRFGGNEYIRMIEEWQLVLANEAIERMQVQLSTLSCELEAYKAKYGELS